MSKDSKETELHFIKHYKKSMDKNPDNVERVLHCLQRLEKLRMNVNLLEQTGIGKTVANIGRKPDSEAGSLARKLLHKWKEIVAKHESSSSSSASPKKVSSKLSATQSSEASSGTDDAAVGFKSPATTTSNNGKSSRETHKSSSSHNNHHHHHTKHHSSSSKEKTKTQVDSKSSSSTHRSSSHHKSHNSSSSSSSHKQNNGGGGESSKRKCDDSSSKSTKSKDESAHKKPKNTEEKAGNHREKHTSSSSSSSKNRNKDSESSKKSKQEIKQEGFDGSEGLGFAEALAMFDMPSTSSSSSLSKKKDIFPVVADKVTITKTFIKPSSSSKDEKKKSSSSSSKLNELRSPPKLLLQKPAKLEPLPDIVNEIPTEMMSIPEYRPAPLPSAVKDYINSSINGSSAASSSMQISRHLKPLNDAEFMTESLSFASAKNRTRVFSGNSKGRTLPAVTSLFDMCVRVLQEHLDFITETGGVPFDIMKPILEKARPEQLQEIEYHNPYLLDESDVLWEAHIKKKFRARKREDCETWREMFERCVAEDEEKLNRLTKNIKKSQEKAVSEVQKTRLAFVDTMVKPPRSVMRKQEIYGTNSKLVSSPAARTDGLKHLAPNIVVAGDVRLRVAAGIRDDAQTFGRARPPLKRAPMMAKLMSKMKR